MKPERAALFFEDLLQSRRRVSRSPSEQNASTRLSERSSLRLQDKTWPPRGDPLGCRKRRYLLRRPCTRRNHRRAVGQRVVRHGSALKEKAWAKAIELAS